ncbi:MAG: CoA transferase [Burkholderiaceae bacterium]|jgi:crotonobetainyl-CoA:carnitine CoA-transferase CaiB-like acyl-CoA transferase|nr:CoA transferase [Burkholderiaceae bacterium]
MPPSDTTATANTDTAPLRGVRVLDLTRLLPGPLGTQYLADMGADVIKIEDTGAGDYAHPALRAVCNRNKRGLQLDLKHPDGQAALVALARTADVLIEGFRPGVTERLGADYATLSRHNPRLVYCSLSGYGQDGPLRDAAGHDINYTGYTGVADQIGSAPDAPALSNLPIADVMGGALTAALGILAALYDAQRSGRGRYLDIALADGALAGAVVALATLNEHGATRPAGGDALSGALACYHQYRTHDGRYLAVGALEPKFWQAFCEQVLGRPDLVQWHRDPRPSQQESVRAELQRIIGEQSLAYWRERLSGVDCCVTPVLKLEETLTHPHFIARGMVRRTMHPVYGEMAHLASPIRMSGHTFDITRQAPLPGEHTREILRQAGYADAAIDGLIANGIARTA